MIDRSRRKLLLYMVGSSLMLGMPKITPASTTEIHNRETLRLVLNSLSDKESVQFIGREYLKQFPREKNISVLASVLDTLPKSHKMTKSEVCSCLAEVIKNDFSTGDVISLKGCLLSRTELRIYAFASLIQ